MNPFSLQFQLGLIQIKVEWEEGSALAEPIRHAYRYLPFYCRLSERRDPDLLIQVHCTETLPQRSTDAKLLFETPSGWSVYQEGDHTLVQEIETISDRRRETSTSRIKWRAWTERDPKTVRFFVLPDGEGPRGNSFWYLTSLVHPFLQILLSALLPLSGGLFLHGLGIDYQKKGILFLGGDGAGKSTLAGFWDHSKAGSVLNDDRLILQRVKGRWTLFGTPWHGDFQKVSPGQVPLERICFISHAPQNRLEPLSPREAFEKLIGQLFLAFWKKESVDHALQLCEELISFPTTSFGFIRDPSAVAFFLDSFNSVSSSRPVLPAVAPT